jgi:glycosyltransferase involved in cell wall biosynthesis
MLPEKRLLLITERFAPDLGGVARSAARTAAAIARLGVEVHVLAWTRMLPAGQFESRVLHENTPSRKGVVVHRLGLFANLDYSLQYSMTLIESLHRRELLDGVWGHYLFPAGFLAVLFAGTVGIPATVSARGNDIDMLMFPPGDFARLTWTLERACSITAVSGDLLRKVRLLAGKGRPAQVVPNSVDVEVFRPAPADEKLRTSLGILPDEAVLGFSGELRQKKGLVPLLQAFREVRNVRPACLLVIGEVRIRDQAILASFAAEHPEARSRLIVTGHIEDPGDVARHLRICDLFLQPSLWDGLPNAVLEAMACERLVIASDAGGLPEVIEHGRSGFLIPRIELHRLGEAIREGLALEQDHREAIGRAARERILHAYSAEQEVDALRLALGQLWG